MEQHKKNIRLSRNGLGSMVDNKHTILSLQVAR